MPVLVSLLWLFHPIHTEVVANIKSAAIYFLTRQHVLATYATPFVPTVSDNLLMAAPDIPTRWATAVLLLGKYLLLLLVPYQLVSDYSFNQIPLTGWTNPLVWLSFLVYSGALIWAFKNIKKKSMIVFGLLFYLITMSIYCNLCYLIGKTAHLNQPSPVYFDHLSLLFPDTLRWS